jgi:hypothetical protein
MVSNHSHNKSIGAEFAALLPENDKAWYKKPTLLYLNFCLFSLFLLSSGNGYDGSILNGLLALPQWVNFMDKPTSS